MYRIYFLLMGFLLLVNLSCEPVYKASNHDEMIKTHKKIAILPTRAYIEIKNVKVVDQIRAQEKLESRKLQESFTNRFIEWRDSKSIDLEIQDIGETNSILEDNSVNLSQIPYKDLCRLLGVDAIITSKVTMAKPLTNSEAFFSMLATGFAFASQVTTVDISIIDYNTGRVAWNFNWVNGGTFISADNLSKALMQAAIKRLPYKSELSIN